MSEDEERSSGIMCELVCEISDILSCEVYIEVVRGPRLEYMYRDYFNAFADELEEAMPSLGHEMLELYEKEMVNGIDDMDEEEFTIVAWAGGEIIVQVHVTYVGHPLKLYDVKELIKSLAYSFVNNVDKKIVFNPERALKFMY